MAQLTGLFQRGGSYFLRIVLPLNHPLRDQYPHGRWVQTLGPCSHREAVTKGTIKRAEVLGGYVASETSTAAPTIPSKVTLKPIYLREVYVRWAKALPRTADTIAACGLALKLYEQQLGNPPIQQLTRAQGEEFRTWLQTLPSSSKTARDRLIWVRALLRYATEDLEWLPRNPWWKLDMPFKTANKRRPWTDDELRLLFSQELYTSFKLPKDAKAGKAAAYWIPLLGLYSGARLGELAQLRAEDIQTIGQIPVMSITNEAEGQSVKTAAGIRLVPIHSELIRLGFLEYVQTVRSNKEIKLWPALPCRKGKPGAYFSQWFGTIRKELGLGKYPDFHCFRHTVRSQLADAEAREDLIDALLGHEVRGSTGTKVYTKRTLNGLRTAIEMIKFECSAGLPNSAS